MAYMTENAQQAKGPEVAGRPAPARSVDAADPAQVLQARLNAITEEARHISRLLPRAVTMSAQGGGLAEALAPTVERAIAVSGKRTPAGLAEALHPVVGSALRRAGGASLRRGIGHLNRFMLKYVSVTGMAWRLEARRAGKPFTQVYLEHTRRLPVKQVFLIHRETGLLLQQAQSDLDGSQDGDVVSGMLTAIGDFIHDSFSVGKDDQLDTIRVGELTILVEQGRHAALAGMLRGDVPPDLREQFRTALGRIHAEFAHELETFDGETAVFDKSRSFLESCLQTLVSTDEVRLLPQTWLVAVLAPLLILSWAGLTVRTHLRWGNCLDALSKEPGIVVVEHGWRGGRPFVYGLRDPAAPSPLDIMAENGFVVNEVDTRWAPFQMLLQAPTLAEVREAVKPPDAIAMEFEDGVLVLRGAATQDWLDMTAQLLKRMPGLGGYRMESVVVSDLAESRRWESCVAQLEREPGLVVLDAGRRDGQLYVKGLRDPLARDPAAIIAQFGIPLDSVNSRWEPYQALNASFTLQRARLALKPSAEVTLDLRGDVLYASGRATHRWIERARVVACAVAGVGALNTDELVDADAEAVGAIRERIEGVVLQYLVGAPDLWPGEGNTITELIRSIDELSKALGGRGNAFQIEIRGHTDSSGDPRRDQQESEELAKSCYESLRGRDIDMARFTTRGMGAQPPPNRKPGQGQSGNRLVSFRVILGELE